MRNIHASASAFIEAPAEVVYAILADYTSAHPGILPEAYFKSYEVEQGGYGAGTVIRFQVRVMGKTRTVRAEVQEPEPGRTLIETDMATGAVTRFNVKPVREGKTCRVTISTRWTSQGFRAFIEGLFAPPLLERIYIEELKNLATEAKKLIEAK